MLTKLIIYRRDEVIYSFAYEQERLIFCLSDQLNLYSEAIYMARLSRLNQASRSAFIEYLPNKSGYLNLAPTSRLQEGSLLAVQLSWLGDGNKQPKFRPSWQLVGKYVVLLGLATPARIKYARGLSAGMARRLEEFALANPAQWVIRTSVHTLVDLELVKAEMQQLLLVAAGCQNQLACRQCAAGVPNYLKLLRSLTLSPDCEVISNDRQINRELLAYQELWQIDAITYAPSLVLERELNWYNNERNAVVVELENGAALEIHQVAGINLIDVNSDRLEISHASLNFLVLDAIYRQICLRNLQGIILLDLLKNMTIAEQAKIITYLQKVFSQDLTQTRVLGFSKAGLCELIRSKF